MHSSATVEIYLTISFRIILKTSDISCQSRPKTLNFHNVRATGIAPKRVPYAQLSLLFFCTSKVIYNTYFFCLTYMPSFGPYLDIQLLLFKFLNLPVMLVSLVPMRQVGMLFYRYRFI